MKHTSRGISMAELLVVMAILCVLLGMLLPSIQRARESGSRTACGNNLRQLGIAIHAYHDANGVFPTGQNGGPDVDGDGIPDLGGSFYWSLRDFVENSDNDGTKPIATYFCPSRRGPETGAKDDFGHSQQAQGPEWMPLLSLNMSLGRVRDGVCNTLLLAHKGMSPRYYRTGIPAPFEYMDEGWAYNDCDRSHFAIVLDRDDNYNIPCYNGVLMPFDPELVPCYYIFSSPHSGSSPLLFGDGSVRSLAYTADYQQLTDPSYPPPGCKLFMNLWNAIDIEIVALE